MKRKLDKRAKTDKIAAVEESKMIDFKALKETVLNERQAKADADAALTQELASDKVAISLTGPHAVDDLLAWIDEIDG
jgi:hypothetical protein